MSGIVRRRRGCKLGRPAAAVVVSVIAYALATAAPAAAASPFSGGIGGYSTGGSPLPPDAPHIPYTNSFLARPADIGKLKVREIHGGPKSGRVLVRVRVRYPHLKRLAARLLSDRATYRGKARVTLKAAESGKRARVSDVMALPLATASQGGHVTHRVLLSRRASKRIATTRGRLKARIRAVASFDQFGKGKAEDRAGDRSRRRVALHRMPGDALDAGDPSPWACAGPGDIPDKGSSAGVHTSYVGGTLLAPWATPIHIRLCRASDRRFDRKDWYALPGFDGNFPTRTENGTLSPIHLKRGYVTITWRPYSDVWWYSDATDHFVIAVNGAGAHADQKETWDFRLLEAPFTMRAMGDSITAGFGYLGSGRPATLSGSDRDFDVAALKACSPIDPPDSGALNNRCSSNSSEGPFSSGDGGRWSNDTGRGNSVSWPAQFADDHVMAFDTIGTAGFKPYRNWAVSGSAPENWIERDGRPNFSDKVDEIVRTDPDLTVLTIGANPILGKMLRPPNDGVDPYNCGGGSLNSHTDSELARDAEQCIRKLIDDYDVYRRLRAIYRRLLDAPNNHIVVAPYPNVYPPMPFYVASYLFVNYYKSFVAERLGEVMNSTVRRAVEDEAARARRNGEGNRLFMMSPKKFNLGLRGYDQVINGAPGEPCHTRSLPNNVDGPTNQSAALQTAVGNLCLPSGGDGTTYMESLDGVHLSTKGARQYANALNEMVQKIGLPVDGLGGYKASWVNQTGPPALSPGEKGTATIRFRNLGTKTIYRDGQKPTRCVVSRPLAGSSEWLDAHASNTLTNASGQPIGVKIDQGHVDQGDDFTCTFHVVAPNKPYGAYPEYFSPVTEGNTSMLPRDDVSLPFSIADEDHVFFPGSSYSSVFIHQQAPAIALAPGETSKVRLTLRNTGDATLYNKGTNPTNCRPSNPRDRKSVWVDKAAPIDQNRVAPGEKFTCTIPIKSPSQFGIYNEYFAPVTENKAWMFEDPPDGVLARLTSADADHMVWPPNEYGANWVNQDYPHETLRSGQKGLVKFTFMNTRRATLYNTGTNPTSCRPSHPTGRTSLWVDGPTRIDQSRVAPGGLFTCTITVTAPSQPGTYNEYFSPWNKDGGWMFNNGVDDVWVPLKSGG